MVHGRLGKCICFLIACCLLLGGCAFAPEDAAVDTVVMALVTPVPTSGTVHISVLATPVPSAIPVPRELMEPVRPPETPSPAPSEAPTPVPSETPASEETPTPKPTKTPKPSAKPTEKPTPKPTATPSPVPTATPVPVETPVPTATPEPTAAPTQAPQNVTVPNGSRYSADDVLLAARVAYFESNKSSEDGLRAVVCVIVNRVESSRWPNSVYNVVYQANQFSVVNNAKFLTTMIPDSVIAYANEEMNVKSPRFLEPQIQSFRAASAGESWGERTYAGTYGGNAFFS